MGGNSAGRPGPLPPRPATPGRMACSAVRTGIGQKKGGKKRHARQTGGAPTALMAVDLRGSEEQPEQVCSWNATRGGPPMDVDAEKSFDRDRRSHEILHCRPFFSGLPPAGPTADRQFY